MSDSDSNTDSETETETETDRTFEPSGERSRDRNVDYLRMLDLPDAPSETGNPPPSMQPGRERPRLLADDPQDHPAREPRSLRNWKLSARLDPELLAELYGAAADLQTAGATVSSLVEEALRLYLPRLRARYNAGRAFAPRGPRQRGTTSQRPPLLSETQATNASTPRGDTPAPVDPPAGGNTRSR